MKIGFIGLGKLGMPCAEEIAKKGHAVLGYDVDKSLNSDYVIVEDTIKDVASEADIVFVAVPTPHDPNYDGKAPTAHLEPKDFQYDIVIDCLQEANKYMNKKQMLVLISTVLPGTVRREFVPLITNTRFVYNPYLIAIWDECECIKVFYNTFISTKIGLVNMIQDVAEKQGNINVDVVTTALAESTQRIMGPSYMKAGMGDGGSCHPRDNIALRYMAKKLDLGYDIFDAVMNAREVQAQNVAQKLCDIAKEKELPILINGIAYKPGVPYIDGSYALLVAQYCTEYGFNPMQVDPLVYGSDPGPFRACVLLSHPELYVELSDDSVVVDPWRSYTSDKHEVIHYGNTR